MATILIWLAVGGLACLLMLFFRNLKTGTALLLSAMGSAWVSSVLRAADAAVPGVMIVGGWVLAGIGWITLEFSLCCTLMEGAEMHSRLNSPAGLLFLAFGILAALLPLPQAEKGLPAAMEAVAAALGGNFSCGTLLCASACAAVCDELPHAPASLFCGVMLAYAFGIFGLRPWETNSAYVAIYTAVLFCTFYGEGVRSSASAGVLLPVLLLQGGGTACCGAILLMIALLVRIRQEKGSFRVPAVFWGCAAGTALLSAILREVMEDGGISGFPDRFASFWRRLLTIPDGLIHIPMDSGLAGRLAVYFLLLLAGAAFLLLIFFLAEREKSLSRLPGLGLLLLTGFLNGVGALVLKALGSELPGNPMQASESILLLFGMILLMGYPGEGHLSKISAAVGLMTAALLIFAQPPAVRYADLFMTSGENVSEQDPGNFPKPIVTQCPAATERPAESGTPCPTVVSVGPTVEQFPEILMTSCPTPTEKPMETATPGLTAVPVTPTAERTFLTEKPHTVTTEMPSAKPAVVVTGTPQEPSDTETTVSPFGNG